jgi:hypothetical protein
MKTEKQSGRFHMSLAKGACAGFIGTFWVVPIIGAALAGVAY